MQRRAGARWPSRAFHLAPLAAILLFGLGGRDTATEEPSWASRAREIEARFDELTHRLGRAHATLVARTASREPELHARLLAKPPARAAAGYQRLPAIVPDQEAATADRATFSTYSWPRTRGRIEGELVALRERLEHPLASFEERAAEAGAPLAELVSAYETLDQRRRSIERSIRHNRLWQPIVHRNPSRYVEATALHDAALERQAILEALGATSEAELRSRAARLEGVDATLDRPELEAALRSRELALVERIDRAHGPPDRRDFLRLDGSAARGFTLHVTVRSDIEDESFLERFEEAVESHWQVGGDGPHYRVDVRMERLSAAELYARSPECAARGECAPPRPGEPVDLDLHASLFPDDSAALTTGASSIRVKGPRCIVLSALDVSPRTLAHELGHVLGFRDRYLRGYRDLGEDGYEILEAVPTVLDIMASPGLGSVRRFHFEALAAATREGCEGEAAAPCQP